MLGAQSRESAKLFLQSSALGLPKPLTLRRVCPPPSSVLGGGANSLAAREGLGESQFRRGDRHCGTLYITYFLLGENRNSVTTSLTTDNMNRDRCHKFQGLCV
jgi:hypothetical protein